MTDPRHQLDAFLAPMEGQEVPGGCDQCDAVQVPHLIEHGVWSIQVRHDDDCPFWLSIQERK